MGGPRRGSGPRRGDRGYATAELAVALPSLVLVLFAALWIVGAVAGQARCAEAARLGARAAARGDDDGAVRLRAAQAAPPGSRVTIVRDGDLVRVGVRTRLGAPGPLRGLLPAVTLDGGATAPAEDATPAGDATTAGDTAPAGDATTAGDTAATPGGSGTVQ